MPYTIINKSTDYFNTKLWTGNASARSITGVGFQPDFVWTKRRDTTGWHYLQDAVRGAANTIYSNATNAETDSGTGGVTSFDSDGFSIGTYLDINANGGTYVGWNWKAGTGQGSSNTDGSINTTYTSVNTTAGFSISKYTGTGSNATVGHGLGVAPKMIIVKNLGASQGWCVFHESIGATKFLSLNSTDASVTASDRFNDTSPTSSVFSVGTHADTNGSSATYIAYCFAEKTGYSKFGSYTGNGNADGAFVYTGFKPAFVLNKRYSSAEGWHIFDNVRDTFNAAAGADDALRPHLNNAEISNWGVGFDFLSNGFKARATDGAINQNGGSYIYMAFGQSLVGSNNIPATSR